MNKEEIQEVINYKIERQLERIEMEEKWKRLVYIKCGN